MMARRATLQARQSEQDLQELSLELEHRYGLLGTTASIDIHTGRVEFDDPLQAEPVAIPADGAADRPGQEKGE